MASEGVVLQDSLGKILFANDAARALLGGPHHSPVGLTSNDFAASCLREDGSPFPAEDHPAMASLRSGMPNRNVVMGLRPDPAVPIIWININAGLIPSRDGEARQVFTVFSDITTHIEAKRRLAANEAQSRLFFDRQTVGMTILSPEKGWLKVNDAFCRLTGYPRDELMRLTLVDLTHPDDVAATDMMIGRVLSGEIDEYSLDKRYIHKSGKIVHIALSVACVRQEDGRVDYILGTSIDISRRKQSEANLVRKREYLERLVAERTKSLEAARLLAEESAKAKGDFLANMSHEIRTPINAILGFTYILRNRCGPGQAEPLDKIRAAGQHLVAIVNDILDLAKIDNGKLTLFSTDFLLADLFANVTSMIANVAAEKGLSVRIDPTSLPPRLQGDPVRLAQSLLNLANNAVKFTQSGSVTLRAIPIEQSDAGLLVRFEVIDTGIGVDADSLARLFNPFEQVDSSATRNHGGTGLGLVITRRLAELMGGSAGAESVAGEGSCFWFTARLQFSLGPIDALAPSDPVAVLRACHSGAHILLADDNPINREVMIYMLEDFGLRVDSAEDGVEALQKASEQNYDLILMDVQMPRMNGLDATRAIRALSDRHRTPILAITANAFAEDRLTCLDAGMDDVVTKPVEPELLSASLLQWLNAPAEQR